MGGGEVEAAGAGASGAQVVGAEEEQGRPSRRRKA